jgi:hypothetical protein
MILPNGTGSKIHNKKMSQLPLFVLHIAMHCTKEEVLACLTGRAPLVELAALVLTNTSRIVLNATAARFDDKTCAISRFLENPGDAHLVERVFAYLYTLSPNEHVVGTWLSTVCTRAATGNYETLQTFVRLSTRHSITSWSSSPELFPAVLALDNGTLAGTTKELYVGATLELMRSAPKLKHMLCVFKKLSTVPDKYTMDRLLEKGHRVTSMKDMAILVATIVPAFKDHGGTLEAAEFFVRLTIKHNTSGLLNPKVLHYLIKDRCSLLLAAVVKIGIGRGWGTNNSSVARAIVGGVLAGDATCERYAPITAFHPECTAHACSWETLVKSGINKNTPYENWVISLLKTTKTSAFYTHVHYGCHHSTRGSNPFPVTAILSFKNMDSAIVKVCKELLVAVQPIKFKGNLPELIDVLSSTINTCNQFYGIRYTVTSGLGQSVITQARAAAQPPWAAIMLFGHVHELSFKWVKDAPLSVQLLEYCIRSRENRSFRDLSVWDALASNSSTRSHLLRSAATDLGNFETLMKVVPETLGVARQLFKRCTRAKGASLFMCLRRTRIPQKWFLPKMRFGFQPGVPSWLVCTGTKKRAEVILGTLQHTAENGTLPHLPKELQHIIVAMDNYWRMV